MNCWIVCKMESKRFSVKAGRRTKTHNREEMNTPNQRSTRSRTSSCSRASTSSSSCSSSSSSTLGESRRRHRSECEKPYECCKSKNIGMAPHARADNSGSGVRNKFGYSIMCSKSPSTRIASMRKSFAKCLGSNSDSDSNDQRTGRKENRGRPKGSKGNQSSFSGDPERRVISCDRHSNSDHLSSERSLRKDSIELRGSGHRSSIVRNDGHVEKLLHKEHSQDKVRLLESRFERPCTRNYGKTKPEQTQGEELSGGVSDDLAFQIRDCRESFLTEDTSKRSKPSTSKNSSTSPREISFLKAGRVSHLKEKSPPLPENDQCLIRRKRLRSELSKDGLWGGLPVMLRYKKHCKPNKLITVNLGQIKIGKDGPEVCEPLSPEMTYSKAQEGTSWSNKEKKRLKEESEISCGFIPLCSPETQPFSSLPNRNETEESQSDISDRILSGTSLKQSYVSTSQYSKSSKEKDEYTYYETQKSLHQPHRVDKYTPEKMNTAEFDVDVKHEREIEAHVSHSQKANDQDTSRPMKLQKEHNSQSSNKVKHQDFPSKSANVKNLMYDLFGSESSDTSPVSKTSSRSSKSGFSVEEACMPSRLDPPLLTSVKHEPHAQYSKDSIRHFHQIFHSSKSEGGAMQDTKNSIAPVCAEKDAQSLKNEEFSSNMNSDVEPSSPSTCQTCLHDCNCGIIDTTSSHSSSVKSSVQRIQDTFKSSDSESEVQSTSYSVVRHANVRPDQEQFSEFGNGNSTNTPPDLSDASWTLSCDNETTTSNDVSAKFSSCSDISSNPRRKVSFHPDSCGLDTSQQRPMIMASRSSGRTLDGCSTQSYLPESVYSPCQQSVNSVATTSIPDVSSDYPNNTADTTQFGIVASRRNVNHMNSIPSSTCNSEEECQTEPTFRGQVHPNSYVFDVTQANDCSTLSCQPESVYSLHDGRLSSSDTVSSLPNVSNDFAYTNPSSAGSSTSKLDVCNPSTSNVPVRFSNDSCNSSMTETSMVTVPSLNESQEALSIIIGKKIPSDLKAAGSCVSSSGGMSQKAENFQSTTDYSCTMQNSGESFLGPGEYVASIDDEFMNSLPPSIQNMFSKDVRTNGENSKSNDGSNDFQASRLDPQTFTCNSSVLVCTERESKVSFTSTNESSESDQARGVDHLGKRPEKHRSGIVKGGYLPSVSTDSTSTASSVDSDLKTSRLRIDLTPDHSSVNYNQRLSGNHRNIHQENDVEKDQPKRNSLFLNKLSQEIQDQMPSTSTSTFSRSFPFKDFQDRCRYDLKPTRPDNSGTGTRNVIDIICKDEKIFESDQLPVTHKSEKDSTTSSVKKTDTSGSDSNSINRRILKYKCRQQKKKYDANKQKIRLKIKSRSRKFSRSPNNFGDRETDADNKQFRKFNIDNIKKEPVESNDGGRNTDVCSMASTSIKGDNSNPKKKLTNPNKSKKDFETTPLSSRTSRTSKYGRVTVKVGSPDSIMTNSSLVEHAKTLWLSENRRQIDHLHDSLMDQDFDAFVEDEWDRLSPKMQIRYYTRAQNALLDEDKHSVRRKRKKTDPQPENDEDQESIRALRRYDTSRFISDLDRFMRLKPNRQRDHLKKWLFFYRKLMSRNDYSRFLHEYEQTLNKSRSANTNDSNKPGNNEIEILHRKLLFECIKKFKPKAMSACSGRFQLKMEELRRLYDEELWKMITRDCEYSYVTGCRSVRLRRVLNELLDLERNGCLDVLGRPLETNSYTSILSDLETPSLPPRNCADQCTDLFADLPPIVNMNLAQQILETQSELPVLDLSRWSNFCVDDQSPSSNRSTGDAIDTFPNNLSLEANKIIEANIRAMMHLDADKAFFRSRESSSRSCCDLDSPSCVLSTWLAADSLHHRQTDDMCINKYLI